MRQVILHKLRTYQYIRERLQEKLPDISDDTLIETLERATNLQEATAALIRSQLDDLSLSQALRQRVRDMQERLARLERRVESKKELVIFVMGEANFRKMEEPDFTVSLRQLQPALLILDESVIPEDYWKPQPPRLDRQAITAALKAGEEIRGAALGNGGLTIAVRTK
ncbi:MAG: siphovirus Gp157 family protein [Alphaproteobacteria bacterium]